ncbi:alpha/beta hydrolase [Bradyrhizobium sp. LA7.1]|uniref:alpha/beta fold hydrolase n=1 Tax=Bradyrhizobium sp. LA7.1 TaxID=3156324 RepID=UPI0033945573
MSYVQVNGVRIYYESRISGKPPLLLCHGAGQDTISWRFNLDTFADIFDVYALDLPGHGKSALAPGGAIDDYTGFLPYAAGFMAELGINRYTYVGHSFAGGLGLHLALAYPDRVDALVLIDGTGCPSKAWGGDAFSVVSVNPVDWLEVNFRLICGPQTSPERAEEIASDVRRCCAPEVALGDIAAFAKTDLRDRLPQVKIPVGFIHGAEDWSIPSELGRETQALLGGKTVFKLLDEAGHFPHTERPDLFNPAFSELWRELTSAKAG